MFISSFDAKYLRNATKRVLKIFEDRIRRISASQNLCQFLKHTKHHEVKNLISDLWGNGDFKIIGIDGSYAVEERLELLLLYVCAAGFQGHININDDNILIDIFNAEREATLKVSASIPLWMEDLPNVNPQSSNALTDYDVKKSIESIPYALMTLAELTLAYKAITNSNVKVVILDRLLSGTYGPASRDFRLMLKRKSSILSLIETPYGNPTMLDLHLAGYLGSGIEYIPPRGIYGMYALIKLLIDYKREDKYVRKSEIPYLLGISIDDAKKIIRKIIKLNDYYNNELLDLSVGDKYLAVKDGIENYWIRTWLATQNLIDKIFSGEIDHPLIIDNHWISTLDINSMNVFLIHKILSEAIRENKLIIGIAKDTSATDLIRAVIPITLKLLNQHHEDEISFLALRSDRALLSMISAANYNLIKTPWRTIEYDSCFATMINCNDKNNVIACAARKAVFREQLFVRGYFQLRSLKSDPSIRTTVFAYDRPFYPKFDSKLIVDFNCIEWRKTSRVKPLLEINDNSFIGDLIIYILSNSDNPNVVEEVGYNHLLFLADKYVKVMTRRARSMLKGIADLDLITIANKYKAYFSARKFRDIRSEIEYIREKIVREEYE